MPIMTKARRAYTVWRFGGYARNRRDAVASLWTLLRRLPRNRPMRDSDTGTVYVLMSPPSDDDAIYPCAVETAEGGARTLCVYDSIRRRPADAPVPPLLRTARPFLAGEVDHDSVLWHLPEIFSFDDVRNVSDAELEELHGRLLSLYDAYQAI
ncbi:hypothetical protein L0U85_15790 [Glycomyces sp. L485]|uniref:hypothetical protein n=1 Tax=Glycomyces sp. L485 TaxID=2909235 RepID=UPI001F4A6478|nr:hypothetical protein [Glycomyces sp. L485]MCH7232306.1 hypothetical protein [Glycomyces sp. L485]